MIFKQLSQYYSDENVKPVIFQKFNILICEGLVSDNPEERNYSKYLCECFQNLELNDRHQVLLNLIHYIPNMISRSQVEYFICLYDFTKLFQPIPFPPEFENLLPIFTVEGLQTHAYECLILLHDRNQQVDDQMANIMNTILKMHSNKIPDCQKHFDNLINYLPYIDQLVIHKVFVKEEGNARRIKRKGVKSDSYKQLIDFLIQLKEKVKSQLQQSQSQNERISQDVKTEYEKLISVSTNIAIEISIEKKDIQCILKLINDMNQDQINECVKIAEDSDSIILMKTLYQNNPNLIIDINWLVKASLTDINFVLLYYQNHPYINLISALKSKTKEDKDGKYAITLSKIDPDECCSIILNYPQDVQDLILNQLLMQNVTSKSSDTFLELFKGDISDACENFLIRFLPLCIPNIDAFIHSVKIHKNEPSKPDYANIKRLYILFSLHLDSQYQDKLISKLKRASKQDWYINSPPDFTKYKEMLSQFIQTEDKNEDKTQQTNENMQNGMKWADTDDLTSPNEADLLFDKNANLQQNDQNRQSFSNLFNQQPSTDANKNESIEKQTEVQPKGKVVKQVVAPPLPLPEGPKPSKKHSHTNKEITDQEEQEITKHSKKGNKKIEKHHAEAQVEIDLNKANTEVDLIDMNTYVSTHKGVQQYTSNDGDEEEYLIDLTTLKQPIPDPKSKGQLKDLFSKKKDQRDKKK